MEMCRVGEAKRAYSFPQICDWYKEDIKLKGLHPRDKPYNYLTLLLIEELLLMLLMKELYTSALLFVIVIIILVVLLCWQKHGNKTVTTTLFHIEDFFLNFHEVIYGCLINPTYL